MAGPAIIVFSQARRLVYRRAVDGELIVWWLQGHGLTPTSCSRPGPWPAIPVLSPGVPLARTLIGTAAGVQMFNKIPSPAPRACLQPAPAATGLAEPSPPPAGLRR